MKPLALLLLSLPCSASTNITLYWSGTNLITATYAVPTNAFVEIKYGQSTFPFLDSSAIRIVIGETNGQSFSVSNYDLRTNSRLPQVVGPAWIVVDGPTYCTLAVNLPPVSVAPDTAGPVAIILEASTDHTNWLPAIPGIYGATVPKQFFRLRAERKE